MLKIRREQMDAFARYSLESFVTRMVERLAGPCSSLVASRSPEEFRALVRDGIDHAERYGITRERAVERFLKRLLGDGSTFDRDESSPVIQEILGRLDTEADDRLDALDDYYAGREGV